MSEPDFINPEGFKWWKDSTLTRHAQRALSDQCTAWLVESPEGATNFVVSEGDSLILEAAGFEAMAYRIDVESLLRRPS